MAALVGGLGTFLGTSIKVFSIGHDLFWVVLLGQAILSASQLLIICLPPRLAAVWFEASKVSTACSLGVFGIQLGTALGFLLTPIIVRNHDNVEDIGSDLRILCWILTIVMVPGSLAICFCNYRRFTTITRFDSLTLYRFSFTTTEASKYDPSN